MKRNMTSDEALDILNKAAIRPHNVDWELSGGGHGEPGGKWVVRGACSCLKHTLTEVKGEDVNKPCDCGAEAHNAQVMEAIRRLRKIVRLFDKACDDNCRCGDKKFGECKHCDLVIEARELMDGTDGIEFMGN